MSEHDNANKPVGLRNVPCPSDRAAVVIVAEDELMIRQVLIQWLQDEGHFVMEAEDGMHGLEVARMYLGSIDLLIADVNMPRMNGLDLCGHLMEERPGIRVLVMSGAAGGEVVARNATLPFLPKPFNGATFKSRVRDVLSAPIPRPLPKIHRATEHSETAWKDSRVRRIS